MTGWGLLWTIIRSKEFRDAVRSILWPRIVKPFLEACAKHLFEEAYEMVLRIALSVEMISDKDVPGPEKKAKYLEILNDELDRSGKHLTEWAKNYLLEIAMTEIDAKWQEFDE